MNNTSLSKAFSSPAEGATQKEVREHLEDLQIAEENGMYKTATNGSIGNAVRETLDACMP